MRIARAFAAAAVRCDPLSCPAAAVAAAAGGCAVTVVSLSSVESIVVACAGWDRRSAEGEADRRSRSQQELSKALDRSRRRLTPSATLSNVLTTHAVRTRDDQRPADASNEHRLCIDSLALAAALALCCRGALKQTTHASDGSGSGACN